MAWLHRFLVLSDMPPEHSSNSFRAGDVVGNLHGDYATKEEAVMFGSALRAIPKLKTAKIWVVDFHGEEEDVEVK